MYINLYILKFTLVPAFRNPVLNISTLLYPAISKQIFTATYISTQLTHPDLNTSNNYKIPTDLRRSNKTSQFVNLKDTEVYEDRPIVLQCLITVIIACHYDVFIKPWPYLVDKQLHVIPCLQEPFVQL